MAKEGPVGGERQKGRTHEEECDVYTKVRTAGGKGGKRGLDFSG